jgi:hypothetical protein
MGGPHWLLKLGLEVVLISAGVFFALVGDGWRERTGQRERAEQALQRFRSEIVENREAVARVVEYHAEIHGKIRAFLSASAEDRDAVGLRLQGIQVVWFESTAWDLALATEALSFIDQDLAFDLADVYDAQEGYADLTGGLLQAMYVRPPSEDIERFLHSLLVYYDDIVGMEPELIDTYDRVLLRIDDALGGAP